MKTYQRLVAAVLLAVATTACDALPFGPGDESVEGTWQGTFTSSGASGNGTAQLTLAEDDEDVTGTWSTTDSTGTASGTVTGSRTSAAVTMTLQSGNPAVCSMSVTAVVTDEQMTGTWASTGCATSAGGTISLTKQ